MITFFEVTGLLRARVVQEFEDDPTMRSYCHVVEVTENTPRVVRVGAPMAAHQQLTNLEITSVVQLLLGQRVEVQVQPTEEIEDFDYLKILRRWRTYPLGG